MPPSRLPFDRQALPPPPTTDADIRANGVVVGSVQTPMVAHIDAEARERRRQMAPMQTEGTAWDIAHGAVYLASDESRWVTGTPCRSKAGW
ncbi:MAG TPA: SDR family oxidoreductase [Reyranella sp.]|nr:SDR family oxidoreductase [Reyranella sp.]